MVTHYLSSAVAAQMAKGWTINGKDLLPIVSCTEPYEWKDPTMAEWEFNDNAKASASQKPFTVSARRGMQHLRGARQLDLKLMPSPSNVVGATAALVTSVSHSHFCSLRVSWARRWAARLSVKPCMLTGLLPLRVGWNNPLTILYRKNRVAYGLAGGWCPRQRHQQNGGALWCA